MDLELYKLGFIALVAFIIKFVIIHNTRAKTDTSRAFIAMGFFLLAQNAFEFIGYFTYLSSPLMMNYLLDGYMISTYFILASILVFVVTLLEYTQVKRIRLAMYSLASIMTVAHFLGYIVSGYELTGYTAISVPGPYYTVFGIYVLGCLISPICFGLVRYFSANRAMKIISFYTIVAVAPVSLLGLSVIILRLTGYDSSSAIFAPLSYIIMLFVFLQHTNNNILWLTIRFKIFSKIALNPHSLTREFVIDTIDEMFLREALELSNWSQRRASKMLKLSEATVSRKISKYGLVPQTEISNGRAATSQ